MFYLFIQVFLTTKTETHVIARAFDLFTYCQAEVGEAEQIRKVPCF